MRNYMMERFLERMSVSQYKDKFILKALECISEEVFLCGGYILGYGNGIYKYSLLYGERIREYAKNDFFVE